MMFFGSSFLILLLFSNVLDIGAQDCPDTSESFHNYFDCILSCYQEWFQIASISGDVCTAQVLLAGDAPKNGIHPSDVESSIHCIAERCRAALPESVCSDLNNAQTDDVIELTSSTESSSLNEGSPTLQEEELDKSGVVITHLLGSTTEDVGEVSDNDEVTDEGATGVQDNRESSSINYANGNIVNSNNNDEDCDEDEDSSDYSYDDSYYYSDEKSNAAAYADSNGKSFAYSRTNDERKNGLNLNDRSISTPNSNDRDTSEPNLMDGITSAPNLNDWSASSLNLNDANTVTPTEISGSTITLPELGNAASINSNDADADTLINSDDEDTDSPMNSNDEDTVTPISSNDEDTDTPTSSNYQDTDTQSSSNDEDTETPITNSNDEDTNAPISSNDEDTDSPTDSNDKDTDTHSMSYDTDESNLEDRTTSTSNVNGESSADTPIDEAYVEPDPSSSIANAVSNSYSESVVNNPNGGMWNTQQSNPYAYRPAPINTNGVWTSDMLPSSGQTFVNSNNWGSEGNQNAVYSNYPGYNAGYLSNNQRYLVGNGGNVAGNGMWPWNTNAAAGSNDFNSVSRYNPGNNYNQGVNFYSGNNLKPDNSFDQGRNFNQGNNFNAGNNYNQGNNLNAGNNYNQGNNFNQGNNYNQGNNFNQGNNLNAGNNYNQGNSFNAMNYFNPGSNSYSSNSGFDNAQANNFRNGGNTIYGAGGGNTFTGQN